MNLDKQKMTFRFLTGLLFVFGICSCLDEQPVKEPDPKPFSSGYSRTYSGISIENGPRQGFQHIDSTGIEYSYRYITTTIMNDSLVPVHLKISFSTEYNHLRATDSLKSKVFLLPRALTPKQQQFDRSMSVELKNYLDTDTDAPVSLDKILNPKEKCVMTFGVLTDMKYRDPFEIELIARGYPLNFDMHDSLLKAKNPSVLSLGLAFDNNLIIPCGQISFSNQ